MSLPSLVAYDCRRCRRRIVYALPGGMVMCPTCGRWSPPAVPPRMEQVTLFPIVETAARRPRPAVARARRAGN